MIRIRVKPAHITIRIDGEPKQRYTSAIHALHIVRVAMMGGQTVKPTRKMRGALIAMVKQAQEELGAAIRDVL